MPNIALQLAFPKRSIEEVQIDAISSLGGNIHRITQEEPTDYKKVGI
ncbi:MAG: hypothetical protein Q9M39_01895 [Sulfurovum sp.]|nr:hypothetical protein [Sulfurovum sp.]